MSKNKLIFNYWLNIQFAGAKNKEIKWKTLEHNGVLFPDNYIYNKIPLIYDGSKIILNIEAEEYAYYYSKYLDTEYIKSSRFNRNYWKGWKKLIDKKLNIIDFIKCDFSLFKKFYEKERDERNNLTKDEKENIKERKDKEAKPYQYCKIDGKQQQVGNFRIEPPSLFLGRGCHPKLGMLKKRTMPQDIFINISRGIPIPKINLGDNYKWGKVIHDNKVNWLASWKDLITGKTKYVFPGDQSDFKAQSDIKKFELAKKLKERIKDIKKRNNDNLESKDLIKKQLATALYFIDKLALRVGNEKGEDQADTVGVSSLRVEHITLLDNVKYQIKLDFLGKDSIRYTNKFFISEIVYNNLELFIKNKSSKEDLFNTIKADDINKYLQSLMSTLTSKVFRTFNASTLFQKELNSISDKFKTYIDNDKVNLLLNEFNKANAKVALLCNHQKKVSKGFNDNINKINEQMRELKKRKQEYEEKKRNKSGKQAKALRERIKKIDEKVKLLKSKKSTKIEMKSVSLGTSKINYIDPRITIAFLKKHKLDVNKLFTKTLQQKFYWAFDVNQDYKF
tara:strand:- start:371 stop:2059 length:1689 start_codon:yes stop_codon:yes gene_type:complete